MERRNDGPNTSADASRELTALGFSPKYLDDIIKFIAVCTEINEFSVDARFVGISSRSIEVKSRLGLTFFKASQHDEEDVGAESAATLAAEAQAVTKIAEPLFRSSPFKVKPEMLWVRHREQVAHELERAANYEFFMPSYIDRESEYDHFYITWLKNAAAHIPFGTRVGPIVNQLAPNELRLWNAVGDVVGSKPLQDRLNEVKGLDHVHNEMDPSTIRRRIREGLRYDAPEVFGFVERFSDNTFTHIHCPDSLEEAIKEIESISQSGPRTAFLAVIAMSALLVTEKIDQEIINSFQRAFPNIFGHFFALSGDNETHFWIAEKERAEHENCFGVLSAEPDNSFGNNEMPSEVPRTLPELKRAHEDADLVSSELSNTLKRDFKCAGAVFLSRDADIYFRRDNNFKQTWVHLSRRNSGNLYQKFLRPIKNEACRMDLDGAFSSHRDLRIWFQSKMNVFSKESREFMHYTNRVSLFLREALKRADFSNHIPIFVDLGYWGTFPFYLDWVCGSYLDRESDILMVESFCAGPIHTAHQWKDEKKWVRSSINQLQMSGGGREDEQFSRTSRFSDMPSAVSSIDFLPLNSHALHHQIDRYRPDLRIPDMKDDLLPDVYKWDISALVDEYFGDAETSFRKFFGEGNYADHDSAFRLNAYREFAETFSEQEQEQEDKPITVIDLECGNGFGGLFLCKALNDQFDGEREIRLHLVDSSQLVVNTIIGEHAKVFVNHGMPDFAPILVQERSEDYLQNCDFENSGSVIVLWERQIGTRGDPGNFLQRLGRRLIKSQPYSDRGELHHREIS